MSPAAQARRAAAARHEEKKRAPPPVPPEVLAKRAAMGTQLASEVQEPSSQSSFTGIGLHPTPDDDRGDAPAVAAPHFPGDSKRSSAAPAPPAVPLRPLPRRLRLTGSEPFIGWLNLSKQPAVVAARLKKCKLKEHELHLGAVVERGKGKKAIPSDLLLHA